MWQKQIELIYVAIILSSLGNLSKTAVGVLYCQIFILIKLIAFNYE